jgi:hypothetical protein
MSGWLGESSKRQADARLPVRTLQSDEETLDVLGITFSKLGEITNM